MGLELGGKLGMVPTAPVGCQNLFASRFPAIFSHGIPGKNGGARPGVFGHLEMKVCWLGGSQSSGGFQLTH